MPFQVKPASYADLDILADVLVKAHVNDKLFQQLFLRVPHEVRVTWYADAFRKTWEEKWIQYHKVVDLESNQIVAMSRFHYPRNLTATERSCREIDYYGPLPAGANTALCGDFFEQLGQYESKYVNREKTYFVYLLATLPEYHRQGLGKQLMDICLQDAGAARAKTFLIATEAGSGLYRKLMFEEIDCMTFDTVPHGGDEKVTWLCMMREPVNKV